MSKTFRLCTVGQLPGRIRNLTLESHKGSNVEAIYSRKVETHPALAQLNELRRHESEILAELVAELNEYQTAARLADNYEGQTLAVRLFNAYARMRNRLDPETDYSPHRARLIFANTVEELIHGRITELAKERMNKDRKG